MWTNNFLLEVVCVNEIESVSCFSNTVKKNLKLWSPCLSQRERDRCRHMISSSYWTLSSSWREDVLRKDSSEESGLASRRVSSLLMTSRRSSFCLLILPNWVPLHTMRAFIVYRSFWTKQLLWNWYALIPIVMTLTIDVRGTWQYEQYLQKKKFDVKQTSNT